MKACCYGLTRFHFRRREDVDDVIVHQPLGISREDERAVAPRRIVHRNAALHVAQLRGEPRDVLSNTVSDPSLFTFLV